jgi:hypothetical protein
MELGKAIAAFIFGSDITVLGVVLRNQLLCAHHE